MTSARFLVLALVLLPFFAACSDEPDRGSDSSSAAPSGPSADPHAGLKLAEPVPASFEGRVLLRGALAAQEGFLMVSVVPRGSALPLMSYKIALAEAPPAQGGERSVPFRLDASNDLMGAGGLPHSAEGMELELSVRFDSDGVVETREGDVTVAVPITPEARAVEVVLGG